MNTSKLLTCVAIAASAILFMGCPYSSSIPLSETGTKVSDNLLGTWELSGGSGDKVEISKNGSTSFVVKKTSASDGTVTNYAGHLTDINGTLFLNVKEEGEYSSYYFYKLTKEGEFKLTIHAVTENITETFEESGAMKKFFEQNMHNSYFYQKDESETYYKIQ